VYSLVVYNITFHNQHRKLPRKTDEVVLSYLQMSVVVQSVGQ